MDGPGAHDPLAGELAALVGPAHCLVDEALTAGYELDWTGRYHGRARLVVRPGDTSEVAEVVRTCARHGAAIVPQGGNTGLVGGSVPRRGEVVLSLRRLSAVARCDPLEGLLEAGAGTTLAEAQRAAAAVGAELGIDLAARESATLGGMVATNAGGVRVVRYGPMRARLGGIEVVLADGTVARRAGGLVKDNVGIDLAGLFCGSEGTLGVVTAVVLRLVPAARHRVAALVPLAGDDVSGATTSALAVATAARAGVDGVEALELVFADGVKLVCSALDLAPPPGQGVAGWLLVEAAGAADPTEALAAALDRSAVAVAGEPAVAADEAGRARLWAYRERHTEAIARLGVAHKLDVTLPLRALPRFAGAVGPAVHAVAPGARVLVFGHVGDGNLHVNVVGPAGDDDRADRAVLDLVVAAGGSVSAEHGIGVAKLDYVVAARDAGDLAVLRRVKAALDPAGLLNPGVLLPN